MKKPLLLLGALCAVAAPSFAAAEHIYMCGEFNSWSPEQSIEWETSETQGVFTYDWTITSPQAFAISSVKGGWDDFNSGRYGVGWNNRVALKGVNNMNKAADNIRLTPGVYHLVIDTTAENWTFDVQGYYTTVYLIGHPAGSNEAGQWVTTKGIELTSENGSFTYQWTPENSGSFDFNLSTNPESESENWNLFNDTRFGASNGGAAIVTGSTSSVSFNKDGSYNYEAGKEYKFTLDTNNMTIEFEGEWTSPLVSSLYWTGDHNGWGTTHEMTDNGDGTHSIKVDKIEAGKEFKLRQQSWDNTSYGTGNKAMKVGETYQLSEGGDNMAMAEDAENVILTADLKKNTLTVAAAPTTPDPGPETGVAAVEASGAVEYFDLQGRRVANPEKGLYIVRQGAKVSKQLLK